MRDGVSVIACNFPVHVPAAPLQSDARETALASCGPRHFHNGARTDNDRAVHKLTIDLLALPRLSSKLEVGPNRKQIVPGDGGPPGTESTDPAARSAVI